jgi:hypothetical protein
MQESSNRLFITEKLSSKLFDQEERQAFEEAVKREALVIKQLDINQLEDYIAETRMKVNQMEKALEHLNEFAISMTLWNCKLTEFIQRWHGGEDVEPLNFSEEKLQELIELYTSKISKNENGK